MPTIRELVGDGDPCGKVKIRHKSWGKSRAWFKPFYHTIGGSYFGKTDCGTSELWPDNSEDGWELWVGPEVSYKREEPAEQLYVWAFQKDSGVWWVSNDVQTERAAEKARLRFRCKDKRKLRRFPSEDCE